MRTHKGMISELVAGADFFGRTVEAVPEPFISERPGADQWSVKEILCHLLDIQRVCYGRIKKMIAEDDPEIEIYDHVRENRERDHSRDDLRRALTDFALDRLRLVGMLCNGGGAVLRRTGRHPEHETFTVEFVLNDMLDHEQGHFEQIKKAAPQIGNPQ
jgi:hypothetical protein